MFWPGIGNGIDSRNFWITGRVAHLCIAPFPRRVPHPCVFCKGGRFCRRNSCPFYTARCVCRRRTRPSPTRRTGHPHLWWLLQFESRATRPQFGLSELTSAPAKADLIAKTLFGNL